MGALSSAGRGTASNEYELLTELATGGMAEIFLARARGIAGLERYVVLKRILRDHAADPRWVEMFLDEARLVARLHHPNIAQVFDLGQIDDTYFFTMEYVHGQDLRALVERARQLDQPLPLPLILGIAAGAAAGLAHAHELCDDEGAPLGIVHRDVSPSNILVSYDGSVKVVDFGVARANQRESKTASGAVKGKISYFSPEQCQNRAVDARTDMFSLGIVMWELCTGMRLYKRDSDFDDMNAIINEESTPPSVVNPALPPALDVVIERALAKRPEDRFPTMRAMQEAIESIAETAGVAWTPTVLRRHLLELCGPREEPWRNLETGLPRRKVAAVAHGSTPSASSAIPKVFAMRESGPSLAVAPPVTEEPRPAHSKWPWLIAALSVLALVIVIVVLVFARDSDRSSPTPDPVVTPAAPAPAPPPEPPRRVVDPPAPPPTPAAAPSVAAPAPKVEPPKDPKKTKPQFPAPKPVKKSPACSDPLECQF